MHPAPFQLFPFQTFSYLVVFGVQSPFQLFPLLSFSYLVVFGVQSPFQLFPLLSFSYLVVFGVKSPFQLLPLFPFVLQFRLEDVLDDLLAGVEEVIRAVQAVKATTAAAAVVRRTRQLVGRLCNGRTNLKDFLL